MNNLVQKLHIFKNTFLAVLMGVLVFSGLQIGGAKAELLVFDPQKSSVDKIVIGVTLLDENSLPIRTDIADRVAQKLVNYTQRGFFRNMTKGRVVKGEAFPEYCLFGDSLPILKEQSFKKGKKTLYLQVAYFLDNKSMEPEIIFYGCQSSRGRVALIFEKKTLEFCGLQALVGQLWYSEVEDLASILFCKEVNILNRLMEGLEEKN